MVGEQRWGRIVMAQECPEEPVIMVKAERRTKVGGKGKMRKVRENEVMSSSHVSQISAKQTGMYRDKQKYIGTEHARELSILSRRIRECKSMTQRKKDHNDPLAYPTYEMRTKRNSAVSHPFKVLEQVNYKKCQKYAKKPVNGKPSKYQQISQQPEQYKMLVLLPAISSRTQNIELSQFVRQLPECNPSALLQFVREKRIYLPSDLQILRARMVHYFGEERVGPVWHSFLRHYQ